MPIMQSFNDKYCKLNLTFPIGKSNGCDLIYDSSCYKVFKVSTPINWLDAQSSCAIWGGDLTSITTERENNYLNTIIPDTVSNCWIGLNDRYELGTYTWIAGTTLNYTNWAMDAPTINDGSICIVMDSGSWIPTDCSVSINTYICKRAHIATTS